MNARARSFGDVLAPDPPRRIPGHRAWSVSLRTAHLATFGVLVGGHVFAVEPPRLWPWLVATVVSGLALTALELASTFAWLRMLKGVAVLVKLALLLAIPIFWEQRVAILVAVTVVASVVSHLPARFRSYRVF